MSDLRGDGLRWVLLPLAGALAALGQAPVALPAFYLAGLVALFIALRAASWRAAARRGWLWGAGYFAASLHWIVEPFLVDLASDGWMAPFALVLMASGMALFPALGAALGAVISRGRGRVFGLVATAAGLALAESLRAFAFTGFPWADAAQAMIDTPFAWLLPIGGPRLVTLGVLALAAMLASLRWPVALGGALAFGLALAWLSGLPAQPSDTTGPLVRIVQPQALQSEKWDPAHIPEIYERHLQLSASQQSADLVVWPEMALPWMLVSGAPTLAQISHTVQGAPVVAGLPTAQGSRYFNSLIVIGAGGRITDQYDKRHLVPFGEYVPLGALLSRLGIRGLADTEGGGFSSGEGAQLIDLPGIGLARPLICYEGVFAEEIRTQQRPRLLLLLTNDAWFGKRAGPQQHFVQARLRAIEQGLPLVRAANMGIAAMIDAHGAVTVQALPDGPAAINAVLPPALAATLYARWGEKIAAALLALVICTLLSAKYREHLATRRTAA